jgi:outer membrane receptor for ferrienterochelin and colicins
VLTNVTVTTRQFGPGLSLSAHVGNLFDSDYAYPGGDEHRQNVIAQDGRTFRIGATYNWQQR